jgi:hypothetical protein
MRPGDRRLRAVSGGLGQLWVAAPSTWPAVEVTLHRVLVHMIAETDRHAGHADIVRELIDGAVGVRRDNDNMAPGDRAWWQRHRDRLERAAKQAGSA